MDTAIRASDALEKTLQQRIAEVYGEALKRAVRNNRRARYDRAAGAD